MGGLQEKPKLIAFTHLTEGQEDVVLYIAYVFILLLRTRNLNLHITSCEPWFSLDCKLYGRDRKSVV